MRIIGIVFIIASSVSVGFRIAGNLKQKCRSLQQFLYVLDVLEREITFSASLLPKALLQASEVADAKLGSILRGVAARMEENRWKTPKTAMEEELLVSEDIFYSEILLALAEKIGRYDIQMQIGAIGAIREQSQNLLSTLQSECGIKSRTYKSLSICAGTAAAILLL